VFYYLSSKQGQTAAMGLDNGSAQPNLSVRLLAQLPMKLPPACEIVQLVKLLNALDDKIELNRRMNETLEAQARALFRDWFVDFGAVKAKMGGDAPYLTPDLWSLFPERLEDDGVPEDWKAAVLHDFVDCQNRKADPDDVDEETPYIGLEHMPR